MNFLTDGQSNYQDEVFKGIQAAESELRDKVFYDCIFAGCSLVEMTLDGCRFSECTFQDCDLSLSSVIGCAFTNVRFERCKLLGINWARATWTPFNSVSFFECNLSHGAFFGLPLKKTAFKTCTAKNCDFSEADLTGATCTGTDFAESRFHHTNLTEADFTGATNYAIHAQHNVLKRTKFSLPQAMSLLYSLDIILDDE